MKNTAPSPFLTKILISLFQGLESNYVYVSVS